MHLILPESKTLLKKVSDRVLTFFSSDYFLFGCFAWFVIQALFYASTVRLGIPPDENYHLKVIQLFADSFPSINLNQSIGNATILEGAKTPFFIYHYLLSPFYLIFGNLHIGYFFLRAVNVCLAILSLLTVVRIADFIKLSKLTRNIAMFMLVNTLMFVFLSAAINYDNLFILLSLYSLYLALRLSRNYSVVNAVLFILTISAGLLVKVSFIPVAASTALIVIYANFKQFKTVINSTYVYFSTKSTRLVLLIPILLMMLIVGQRYIGNISRYGTYAPSCDQINNVEVCRKNPLFSRNEEIYGAKKLPATMSKYSYFFSWSEVITERVYSIFAQKRFDAPRLTSVYIKLLLGLSLVAIIRQWRKKDTLLTLMLSYVVFNTIAVLYVNYKSYIHSGRPTFTVQGRYLFGIVPIFYLISINYISSLLKNKLLLTCVFLVIIFSTFMANMPVYLKYTDTSWYTSTSRKILFNE